MKLDLPKSWKAPFRIETCLEGSRTYFIFDANDKCVLSDLSQEEAEKLRDLFNTVGYEENFMTWRDVLVADVKKIIEEQAQRIIDKAIHRRGWLPTPRIVRRKRCCQQHDYQQDKATHIP